MRILVTGGAGFLGSHLCDFLLGRNHEVICLDNFYTGSKSNITHHLDKKNFTLINHDVVDPFQIEADQIYNLACPASPVHYQKEPIKTLKTSVIGAINVLDSATHNKARILQASTSEVYGDPAVHPQPEEYRGNVNPIGPRACYDEGKRSAETLFFDYHRQHKLDIRVVRIFNTYGPRMMKDDGRVVSNFICQAIQREDITVYGDGGQTRSFCYVSDLIEAMVKMMDQNDTVGPINIGNSNEFSIRELAEKVVALVGSDSKVIYKDLPIDDPTQRKPDSKKSYEILKWNPSIELEEGLKNTIKYFKSIL